MTRSASPKLHERRGRVAAADHRRAGRRGHRLGHSARAGGEGLQLERAHRPVPEDRARPWRSRRRTPRASRGRCRGPSSPRALDTSAVSRTSAAASKRSPSTRSVGSSSRQLELSAFTSASRAQLDPLLLHERVAGLLALRPEEAEAHRAADQQRVGQVEEAVDQPDLVAHLGAAEHHDQRAARGSRRSRVRVVTSRSSSGPAADGRSSVTPTVDACARWAAPNASFTKTSAELGELLGEPAGRSSSRPRSQRVFSSTQHLARVEPRGAAPHLRPDDLRRLVHASAEQLGQPPRDRRERGRRVAPLRPAEVRAEHQLAPAARAAARSPAGPRGCACRRPPRRPSSGTLKSRAHEHRLASGSISMSREGLLARSPPRRPQSTCWARSTHAVRVAPLVVVPGDDLHEGAVQHHRQLRSRRSTSRAS